MKKDNIFQIISAFISGFAIIVSFSLIMQYFKLSEIFNPFVYYLIYLGVILSSTTLVIFTTGALKKRFPQKFSVAIIGFPKTGKTTLLIALYDQILSKRIDFYNIKIVGSETIERVNNYISYLKSGVQIPSTTDQDVYAYRTTIETKSIFSNNIIQIEFGDFPGEQSLQFAEKYENWFHRTPYFRWVKDANAYIYVIDCGEYLIKKTLNDKDKFRNEVSDNGFRKYKARTQSSMRASWQHLLEYNFDIKLNIANNPLILVFTKSDTLIHYFLLDLIIENSLLRNKYKLEYEDKKAELLQEYLNIVSYNKIPLLNNNLSISNEHDNLQFWAEIYVQTRDFLKNKIGIYEYMEYFGNKDIHDNYLSTAKIADHIIRVNKIKIEIEKDFNDIIKYFDNESKNFKILYMSSFGIVNDRKTDSGQFKQLLDYLFPNL